MKLNFLVLRHVLSILLEKEASREKENDASKGDHMVAMMAEHWWWRRRPPSKHVYV